MESHLDILLATDCVAEWLTPWDERLVALNNGRAPNPGGSLQDEWIYREGEEESIAQVVGNLVLESPGLAKIGFTGRMLEGIGRVDEDVVLEFDSMADLKRSITIARSRPVINRPDKKEIAWAGVGLLSPQNMALAIFAGRAWFMKLPPGRMQARIKPVPQEELLKLVG